MEIVKIQIERFKGIRDLEVSVPSTLQLIAGANNSGKSTFMQALDLFFSGVDSQIECNLFQPKNQYYGKESPRALTTIKIHFSKLTTNEKNDFKEALLSRTNSFWCQLKISRTGQVKVVCSGVAEAKFIYEKLISKFTVFHIPVLRVSQHGFSDTESRRLMKAVSEVLIRKRPGPKSSDQKRFESETKRLKKLIAKVFIDAKGSAGYLLPSESEIQFEFPNNSDLLDSILDKIWIKSRPKDGLTLKEEGTGYQSLLALGLLKHIANQESSRRNQNLLILLEEPEAFLHPQYQRRVAEYLEDISKSAQIFVSTHSPTIIDATDVQNVIRLERNFSGLKLNWHPETMSEKTKGNLSRWCDSKNSELIFSDRVIFCEGPSDVSVVKKIILSIKDLSSLVSNISVISMDSRDNGDKFAELVARFNIPSLFIFDRDIHSGDRATLKKMCETFSSKLSQADYTKLDKCKPVTNDYNENMALRDTANQVLSKRHIFCLSSDIECALVTAYNKDKTIRTLLNLQVIDQATSESLGKSVGVDFHVEINKAIGSKGWHGASAKNKIKPHFAGLIVDELGTEFNQNSDLLSLRKAIREFLSSKKH
ncbi:MAG: AAA family ATPase [Bdellovibrionales bacterium]|nr:AAA family ATPase [Bdellovibrionales bacterium]